MIKNNFHINKDFNNFKKKVNLIFVIDHAGRAGNGFYQTIFDQHDQVLVCTWLHYLYSYTVNKFNDQKIFKSNEILDFFTKNNYFNCLYNEENEIDNRFITKMGGDPKAEIDRQIFRANMHRIVLQNSTITRKDFFIAIYFSFGISIKKNLNNIKYLLSCDSISLRKEGIHKGYSGKVLDEAIAEFPNLKFVHLTRDPRAGFASTHHQYLNSHGNMYGIKLNNFLKRFIRLIKGDFNWDQVFVFGFWNLYFFETYKTIFKKKKFYKENFFTLKNEDLNLSFEKTMKKHAKDLDIKYSDNWNKDFVPTMLGKKWSGTGAYNSNYQSIKYSIIKTNNLDKEKKITGPNEYVTSRWKTQLSYNEIYILEFIHRLEIKEFRYENLFIKINKFHKWFFYLILWMPLKGEIPRPDWILNGIKISSSEFVDRLTYLFLFPIFYFCSRIVFIFFLLKKKII